MNKKFAFTDIAGQKYSEWDSRKLGLVGETFTGLAGKTKEDFGRGSSKFITYMNVFANKVATEDMLELVDVKEGEKQNSVSKGDILFTTSSETLKDVGRASLWNHETSVYLNSFCFGFRNNSSDVDSLFLVNLLHSPLMREAITRLGQGSTRINISKTRLMNLPIDIPSLPEQKQIAEFFSALDERVELQSEKVALLREQKRGFQQRVFSGDMAFTDDNGNPYPAWEEKKLSDIAKLVTGNTPPTDDSSCWDGDYPWITPGDMGQNKYVTTSRRKVTGLGLEKSRYLPAGSLVVTCIGATIGKSAILAVEGSCNQQNNVVLPSDTLSVEYIYYFLETQVDKMKGLAGQTATPILNKTTFGQLLISLPSLPEQEKIAAFFSALDESIALNDRKLELLKEQKKGYLQGIFG